MGITQTILFQRSHYCNEYNLSPQELNSGVCGDFADIIGEQVPNAIPIWGDDVCPMLWSNKVLFLLDWFTHFTGGHCFVMFNDRFYDSECPQGCDYPDELPFYQRQIAQFYSGKKGTM